MIDISGVNLTCKNQPKKNFLKSVTATTILILAVTVLLLTVVGPAMKATSRHHAELNAKEQRAKEQPIADEMKLRDQQFYDYRTKGG